MATMQFKEIPQSWLIAGLGIALVGMRYFGLDSWTTAAISSLMGYLLGSHIQANKDTLIALPSTSPVVLDTSISTGTS
jgi:hypothetical protein